MRVMRSPAQTNAERDKERERVDRDERDDSGTRRHVPDFKAEKAFSSAWGPPPITQELEWPTLPRSISESSVVNSFEFRVCALGQLIAAANAARLPLDAHFVERVASLPSITHIRFYELDLFSCTLCASGSVCVSGYSRLKYIHFLFPRAHLVPPHLPFIRFFKYQGKNTPYRCKRGSV